MIRNILNNQIGLTARQLVTHYLVVILLLFFEFLLVYVLVTSKANGYSVYGLIGAVSAVLLITFLWQRRRLSFRMYKFNITDQQFKEAVMRTAVYLEWSVEVLNDSYARAFRGSNFSGSWGEMISIKHEGGSVYINSICNPYARSSVASYGWNERNRVTFVGFVNDVMNGVEFSGEVRAVGKLWTRIRILKAFLLYPICVFLLIFGVFQVLHFRDLVFILTGFLFALGSALVLFVEYRSIREYL